MEPGEIRSSLEADFPRFKRIRHFPRLDFIQAIRRLHRTIGEANFYGYAPGLARST